MPLHCEGNIFDDVFTHIYKVEHWNNTSLNDLNPLKHSEEEKLAKA